MLEVLSEGFREAKLKLKGKATLSEEVVDEALVGVRKSLLEADVEYTVAKNFLKRVKDVALGKVVSLKAGTGTDKMKVSPQDHFIQICQEELEDLMGPEDSELKFPVNKPAVIMMVGLQGCGKTTTSGKLANFLKKTKGKKPLLVAADIYRPAAVDQLQVLGKSIEVPVFTVKGGSPVDICHQAIKEAYDLECDTIILDTAGRLTIDSDLMEELSQIKEKTNPDNILLVCDAMMGQDAVTTSKAFDEKLSLSGSVVTKLDGDARGGAALSIKSVTGKPIKFLGMGEEIDRLEEFRPQGLASRILGMGDIVGLMDDFNKVSKKDQEQDMMKMLKGEFNYLDFYKQIESIQKMGPLKDIIAKLPMQDMIPKGVDVDDKELTKIKSIIDSMTVKERIGMDSLVPSRINRIAKGAGRTTKDIKELITKFTSMKKMMGSMGKNLGMMGKIPGMGSLKQMNQMRKAMKGGGGGGFPGMGGGFPGMPDMSSMMGGMGDGGADTATPRKKIDRNKQKKLRKAAKNARKKNRK